MPEIRETREEKVLHNAVVVLLFRAGKILLALKTKKIGAGFLNGYGGGIEELETPRQTAVRELAEEVGLDVASEHLMKVGDLYFLNTMLNGETFECRVRIYCSWKWAGEPRETETMKQPTWFPMREMPYERMMPADRIWFPIVLSGKKVRGKFPYGPFQQELIGDYVIEEVESFLED